MTIGLGIDTGGTYTDGVLMDMESKEILGWSKALTTRDDLTKGISETIRKLDLDLLKKVSLVSLSSTLATNTVVEGKGCRVGVLCIGREYDESTPANEYAFVSGSHDLDGNETAPLDENTCIRALNNMNGKIDAVAISGYLSIRNPEHEERVAELTKKILNVPAICGHELSKGLGFNERTTTAIMNARLIPVIANLILSVRSSLDSFGITAPLMIVKGDGSVMNSDTAVSRPVETILSGPASSIMGARAITGELDAIVIDMGGTTTDIGVLRNGYPRLEKEGAIIEGRRTRVLAASVSTFGIGGDSRIVVNGTKTLLTPIRAMPICIAAIKWPRIKKDLEKLKDMKPTVASESVNVEQMRQDTEFFVSARPYSTEILLDFEKKFLNIIHDNPMGLKEGEATLGVTGLAFSISKMERLGLLTRIGVTPTDILHAEGTYMEYDGEASTMAVNYLSVKTRMDTAAFISMVKDMVVYKIAKSLMDDLIMEESNAVPRDPVSLEIVKKAITGQAGIDYGVSIGINKPIIGIGAPVSAWLPQIASIFGTKLIISEKSEVGNAIGAISGSVTVTETVLIRPITGNISANPQCIVFTDRGKFKFESLDDAMNFAKKECSQTAIRKAKTAGARNVSTDFSVRKKTYHNEWEDSSEALLEAIVEVRATGKPDFSDSQVSD